jgi:hypothetical protein
MKRGEQRRAEEKAADVARRIGANGIIGLARPWYSGSFTSFALAGRIVLMPDCACRWHLRMRAGM